MDLIVVVEIFADGVHDQSEEVRVLVHEKRYSEVALQVDGYEHSRPSEQVGGTYNLLFAVLRTRDEVHGLHVPDIDLVPENVRENDLCHIPNRQTSQSTRKTRQESSVGIYFFFWYPSRLPSIANERQKAVVEGEYIPLNRFRIFAISLLIRFSSSSLTRAPRMSAMN